MSFGALVTVFSVIHFMYLFFALDTFNSTVLCLLVEYIPISQECNQMIFIISEKLYSMFSLSISGIDTFVHCRYWFIWFLLWILLQAQCCGWTVECIPINQECNLTIHIRNWYFHSLFLLIHLVSGLNPSMSTVLHLIIDCINMTSCIRC